MALLICSRVAFRLRQGRDERGDVDPEKAALVLDPSAGLGLRDPCAEFNVGEPRHRHAGADWGCGDHQRNSRRKQHVQGLGK